MKECSSPSLLGRDLSLFTSPSPTPPLPPPPSLFVWATVVWVKLRKNLKKLEEKGAPLCLVAEIKTTSYHRRRFKFNNISHGIIFSYSTPWVTILCCFSIFYIKRLLVLHANCLIKVLTQCVNISEDWSLIWYMILFIIWPDHLWWIY
jgi:hypothetical protein